MEKMGNTFDKEILKSPLTVNKDGSEKGPAVTNNPVLQPSDPLGLMPGGKKGK